MKPFKRSNKKKINFNKSNNKKKKANINNKVFNLKYLKYHKYYLRNLKEIKISFMNTILDGNRM
jgi:hypothetical protein